MATHPWKQLSVLGNCARRRIALMLVNASGFPSSVIQAHTAIAQAFGDLSAQAGQLGMQPRFLLQAAPMLSASMPAASG